VCRRFARLEKTPTWSSSMDRASPIRAALGRASARRCGERAVCWLCPEVSCGDLPRTDRKAGSRPADFKGVRSSDPSVRSRTGRRPPVHTHRAPLDLATQPVLVVLSLVHGLPPSRIDALPTSTSAPCVVATCPLTSSSRPKDRAVHPKAAVRRRPAIYSVGAESRGLQRGFLSPVERSGAGLSSPWMMVFVGLAHFTDQHNGCRPDSILRPGLHRETTDGACLLGVPAVVHAVHAAGGWFHRPLGPRLLGWCAFGSVVFVAPYGG